MSYTKKKWKYIPSTTIYFPLVTIGNSSIAITAFENKDEKDHNAKLISAAPELLEACMEFVRKVECGEAKSKRSYKQMKEAIKKALI